MDLNTYVIRWNLEATWIFKQWFKSLLIPFHMPHFPLILVNFIARWIIVCFIECHDMSWMVRKGFSSWSFKQVNGF